ncbi:MAG: hypothetical protein QM804_10260 [Propionicimonas sp.]
MTEWLTQRQRERLRVRLHEIPDLIALVETQHATLLPKRPTVGGRPTPGSRPPVNLDVLDLLDDRPKLDGRRAYLEPGDAAALDQFAGERREGVLRCLADWVRLAEEEMDGEGYEHIESADQPTITTEAGWLARHLNWIGQRQWARDEFEPDIRRIHHDMQAVVGEGRPEYRPRCPKCQGRMADEGSYFTCEGCGESVRTEALDHRRELATGQPMDAYSFGAYGIEAATIRKWVERGDLQKATDLNGRELKRGRRDLFWPLDVLRVNDVLRNGA